MNTYNVWTRIVINESDTVEAKSAGDACDSIIEKYKKDFGSNADIEIKSWEIEGGGMRSVTQ